MVETRTTAATRSRLRKRCQQNLHGGFPIRRSDPGIGEDELEEIFTCWLVFSDLRPERELPQRRACHRSALQSADLYLKRPHTVIAVKAERKCVLVDHIAKRPGADQVLLAWLVVNRLGVRLFRHITTV